MSALIALILLAAAVWFVAGSSLGPDRTGEPMESVSDFSRAMRALDPTAPPPRPAARAVRR